MKKALSILILFGGAGIAFADSTSTIQLPTDFGDRLVAVVSATISNFSNFILIVVGVLLSAVVIEILIDAIRGRK